MSSLTLQPDTHATLKEWLAGDDWVVACLCAAWCDTCRAYRSGFDALAARHPDKHFIWIDIEDESDIVGDIDVENFPTLLIQRGDRFFTVPVDYHGGLRWPWLERVSSKAAAPLDALLAPRRGKADP